MNDLQILTVALSVVVPFSGIVIASMLGNARLTDIKEALRAEINLGTERLSRQSDKNHAEVIQRLTALESRVAELEQRRV